MKNINSIKSLSYCLGLFLISYAFCAFIPIWPSMPSSGLDASWTLAMGQAVIQKLKFGQDIIFTFGPFASLYTKNYFPLTYSSTMEIAAYFSASYAAMLLFFSKGNILRLVTSIFIIACGMASLPDILFFSYPIICVLCIDEISEKSNEKQNLLIILIITFPLGLLSLVKGSFLTLSVITTFISAVTLSIKRKKLSAIICIASPLLSIVTFWLISKQPLNLLSSYIISTKDIISGYTEAMSSTGPGQEISIFLIACLLLATAILKCTILKQKKILLIVTLGFFLFMSFKAGFVRHDIHAVTAGSAIVMAALLFLCFSTNIASIVAVFLCVSTGLYLTNLHLPISLKNNYLQTKGKYISAGIYLENPRLAHKNLRDQFDSRMRELQEKSEIPLMPGTFDIYSEDQGSLIASGNKWNPRPIIQSYSAYTSALIRDNENHLLGNRAPDNLVIRINSIDNRIPLLEDGASWPIILQNYHPANFSHDTLILQKNNAINNHFPMKELSSITSSLGQSTKVPDAKNPIYVEIEMKKTLIGSIEKILFKPNQLKISLNLSNGTHYEYRIIPEMAKSGFIISPLITKTSDFYKLYYKNDILKQQSVKSLTIEEIGTTIHSWDKNYKITFKQLSDFNTYPDLDESAVPPLSPGEIEAAPRCSGFIDTINHGPGNGPRVNVVGHLTLDGWLALDATAGSVPNATYVSLTDSTGKVLLFPTKNVRRADVAKFFNQSNLEKTGFQLTTTSLPANGQYTLGLAYAQGSKTYMCPQFKIQTTILNTPSSHANN